MKAGNWFPISQEQYMSHSSCSVNIWMHEWMAFPMKGKQAGQKPVVSLCPGIFWGLGLTIPLSHGVSLGFSLEATHWKPPVPISSPSSSQLACRAQGRAFQIGSCLVWCCKTHWELLPFGFMILIVLQFILVPCSDFPLNQNLYVSEKSRHGCGYVYLNS